MNIMALFAKRSSCYRLLSMVLGMAVMALLPAGCGPEQGGSFAPVADMGMSGDMLPPDDMTRPSHCVNDAGVKEDGVWKPGIAQLLTPVSGTAGALAGDEVWVLGGRNASGLPTAQTQVLDLRTLKVRRAAPLPVPLYNLSAAYFHGEVLALGGKLGDQDQREVYVYDPVEDKWKQWNCRRMGVGPTCDWMQGKRQRFQATVAGDRLCVAGSVDGGTHNVECHTPPPYDLSGRGEIMWYSLASFPDGGVGTATAFWNNQLCVVGGESLGMGMDGVLFKSIRCVSSIGRDAGGTWNTVTSRELPKGATDVLATSFNTTPERQSLFVLLGEELHEIKPDPFQAPEDQGIMIGGTGASGTRPLFVKISEGILVASPPHPTKPELSGLVSIYCAKDRPR